MLECPDWRGPACWVDRACVCVRVCDLWPLGVERDLTLQRRRADPPGNTPLVSCVTRVCVCVRGGRWTRGTRGVVSLSVERQPRLLIPPPAAGRRCARCASAGETPKQTGHTVLYYHVASVTCTGIIHAHTLSLSYG